MKKINKTHLLVPYFQCICGHNYLFVCLFVIVVIFSVLGLFFVTLCISVATVTSLLGTLLYDGMPVFPSLPSLSPFISSFCYRLNFPRRTRAETLATQASDVFLRRLDVKSQSVPARYGHNLLDTMFFSRVACHRTQYLKLLLLHWRSRSTDSRLFEGVRAFEDIPEPNGWKLMYDLSTKTEHFAKGYKLFERLFEELGPICKESVLLSPKTTVHVIEPEDIENVFRAEGKYPRRLQLDIWLEYRKRRNYFSGLILL